MICHILNGDALVDRFEAMYLSGEMLTMRECLIEGDLHGNTLDDFVINRTRYLAAEHNADPNKYAIADLIEKIIHAPEDSEFNLWFEHDLFCQVNLWFLLSLIHRYQKKKTVKIIYPISNTSDSPWGGYGFATISDLYKSFELYKTCQPSDLMLAASLWDAYKIKDLTLLNELSGTASICFPYLSEVCAAHIARYGKDGSSGRPEKRIQSILNEFPNADFYQIFMEFSKSEGVYGFGDDQLKHILNQMTT